MKFEKIIWGISMAVILIFALLFILSFALKPYYFKDTCRMNNGTYVELQNITCAVNYPNCFMRCELINGTSIGYYDDWSSFSIVNVSG